MATDLVSLVEAAYLREVSLDKWLENLVKVADKSLSGGRGVFGVVMDGGGAVEEKGYAPGARPNVIATSISGMPDRILEAAAPLLEFAPNEMLMERYQTAGPVGTLSSVFAKHHDFDHRLSATGFADALYLRANGGPGVELVLSIPADRPIRLPGARKLLLSYVASHIKTAYRLRSKQTDIGSEGTDVEAIMSPDGTIEHASGEAATDDSRAVLRAAARACVRAKSKERDVDDATALGEWKALFNGRWSVIDHFDTDGKMFVIACRNEPEMPQAKGLTPREMLVADLAAQGYSNKEIHYELGWPLSTIASCLASAILKLGVTSRTALVRVLSSGRRA
jgi:DNA-binding CsgD family transcriptional regulator